MESEDHAAPRATKLEARDLGVLLLSMMSQSIPDSEGGGEEVCDVIAMHVFKRRFLQRGKFVRDLRAVGIDEEVFVSLCSALTQETRTSKQRDEVGLYRDAASTTASPKVAKHRHGHLGGTLGTSPPPPPPKPAESARPAGSILASLFSVRNIAQATGSVIEEFSNSADPAKLAQGFSHLYRSIDHGGRGFISWEQLTTAIISCGSQGWLGEIPTPFASFRLEKPHKLPHLSGLVGVTNLSLSVQEARKSARTEDPRAGRSKLKQLVSGVVQKGNPGGSAAPGSHGGSGFDKPGRQAKQQQQRSRPASAPTEPQRDRSKQIEPGLLLGLCKSSASFISQKERFNAVVKFDTPGSDVSGHLTCAVYIDTYKAVAIGSADSRIRVYETEFGREVANDTGLHRLALRSPPTCLAFSSLRNALVVGCRNGEILSAEGAVRIGSVTCEFNPKSCVQPDGSVVSQLLSARDLGVFAAFHSGSIVLLDPVSLACLKRFEGHTRGVTSLAFCSDYSLLVSAGFGWDIYLWMVTWSHGKPLKLVDRTSPHTATIAGVAAIPGNAWIVSADKKGVVKVWDGRTLGCLQSFDITRDLSARHACQFTVTSLSVVKPPEGSWRIAVAGDRQVWTFAQEELAFRRGTDTSPVVTVAYSDFSRLYYTASLESVKTWDSGSGMLLTSQPTVISSCLVETAAISAFAVEPKGRRYIVGYVSGYVAVFNATNGDIITLEDMGAEIAGITCTDSHIIVASLHEIALLSETSTSGSCGGKALLGKGRPSWSLSIAFRAKRLVAAAEEPQPPPPPPPPPPAAAASPRLAAAPAGRPAHCHTTTPPKPQGGCLLLGSPTAGGADHPGLPQGAPAGGARFWTEARRQKPQDLKALILRRRRERRGLAVGWRQGSPPPPSPPRQRGGGGGGKGEGSPTRCVTSAGDARSASPTSSPLVSPRGKGGAGPVGGGGGGGAASPAPSAPPHRNHFKCIRSFRSLNTELLCFVPSHEPIRIVHLPSLEYLSRWRPFQTLESPPSLGEPTCVAMCGFTLVHRQQEVASGVIQSVPNRALVTAVGYAEGEVAIWVASTVPGLTSILSKTKLHGTSKQDGLAATATSSTSSPSTTAIPLHHGGRKVSADGGGGGGGGGGVAPKVLVPSALAYDNPTFSLVVGGDVGGIQVYCIEKLAKPQLRWQRDAHDAGILSVVVVDDTVVTSGSDHTVRIWSLLSGAFVAKLDPRVKQNLQQQPHGSSSSSQQQGGGGPNILSMLRTLGKAGLGGGGGAASLSMSASAKPSAAKPAALAGGATLGFNMLSLSSEKQRLLLDSGDHTLSSDTPQGAGFGDQQQQKPRKPKSPSTACLSPRGGGGGAGGGVPSPSPAEEALPPRRRSVMRRKGGGVSEAAPAGFYGGRSVSFSASGGDVAAGVGGHHRLSVERGAGGDAAAGLPSPRGGEGGGAAHRGVYQKQQYHVTRSTSFSGLVPFDLPSQCTDFDAVRFFLLLGARRLRERQQILQLKEQQRRATSICIAPRASILGHRGSAASVDTATDTPDPAATSLSLNAGGRGGGGGCGASPPRLHDAAAAAAGETLGAASARRSLSGNAERSGGEGGGGGGVFLTGLPMGGGGGGGARRRSSFTPSAAAVLRGGGVGGFSAEVRLATCYNLTLQCVDTIANFLKPHVVKGVRARARARSNRSSAFDILTLLHRRRRSLAGLKQQERSLQGTMIPQQDGPDGDGCGSSNAGSAAGETQPPPTHPATTTAPHSPPPASAAAAPGGRAARGRGAATTTSSSSPTSAPLRSGWAPAGAGRRPHWPDPLRAGGGGGGGDCGETPAPTHTHTPAATPPDSPGVAAAPAALLLGWGGGGGGGGDGLPAAVALLCGAVCASVVASRYLGERWVAAGGLFTLRTTPGVTSSVVVGRAAAPRAAGRGGGAPTAAALRRAAVKATAMFAKKKPTPSAMLRDAAAAAAASSAPHPVCPGRAPLPGATPLPLPFSMPQQATQAQRGGGGVAHHHRHQEAPQAPTVLCGSDIAAALPDEDEEEEEVLPAGGVPAALPPVGVSGRGVSGCGGSAAFPAFRPGSAIPVCLQRAMRPAGGGRRLGGGGVGKAGRGAGCGVIPGHAELLHQALRQARPAGLAEADVSMVR